LGRKTNTSKSSSFAIDKLAIDEIDKEVFPWGGIASAVMNERFAADVVCGQLVVLGGSRAREDIL
jgi:hypothetical protein